MSNTSNYNIPLQKPKKVQRIENDISVLEKKHDYYRTNVFKWFILIGVILVISCLVFSFIYLFFTNQSLQEYIINQIKNNIVFILVSSLAILKINIQTSN